MTSLFPLLVILSYIKHILGMIGTKDNTNTGDCIIFPLLFRLSSKPKFLFVKQSQDLCHDMEREDEHDATRRASAHYYT
jgi:hypothetical protein